jgi:TRAP-type C4-dicarboxylate transport system permease small subunit
MIGVLALAVASDPRPADNDVVAGWVGAAVFVGLILAVAFILRSFTKQLKKVEAADKAGVYADPSDASQPSDLPPTHQPG